VLLLGVVFPKYLRFFRVLVHGYDKYEEMKKLNRVNTAMKFDANINHP